MKSVAPNLVLRVVQTAPETLATTFSLKMPLYEFLSQHLYGRLIDKFYQFKEHLLNYQRLIQKERILSYLQYAIDNDFSKQQLKQFAKSIFSFPIGAQHVFASEILSYGRSLRSTECFHRGIQQDCSVMSLWSAWKSGSITPMEIYQSIQEAVEGGYMDSQGTSYLIIKFLTLDLIEGRDITNNLLCLTGFHDVVLGAYTSHRWAVTTAAVGDEIDISSTFTLNDSRQSIVIFNSNHSWTILPSMGNDLSSYAYSSNDGLNIHFIYPKAIHPTMEIPEFLSSMLWYQHKDVCDISVEKMSTQTVLTIGTHVKVESTHLDIYNIVAVDRTFDLLDKGMSVIHILVDGHLHHNLPSDDDKSTDSSMDGWEDNRSYDPMDDSQSDKSSPFPVQTYEHVLPFNRSFYVLTCLLKNEYITTRAIIKLDILFKDQRPIVLIHLEASGFLVVAGTCGLLAMIDMSEPRSNKKSQTFHLVQDSFLSTATTITHRAEAVIGVIDYSYHSGCIISGDNLGTVCLWKLHLHPHRLRERTKPASLFCPPYNLGSRISMMRFSPSGLMIVVAIQGRLYLLGVNASENKKNLYIHAVLDK